MSPAFQDSLPEPDEGWGVVRPGDRKAHYYRNMDSLCRRVGFYNGPLEPDENHSPDDCDACRKVLDREAVIHGRDTDPLEASKRQIADFHRPR